MVSMAEVEIKLKMVKIVPLEDKGMRFNCYICSNLFRFNTTYDETIQIY